MMMATSATQSTAAAVWETVKENAAPLQRGRNVAALEQSAVMTDEERLQTERMVQYHEHRVQAAAIAATAAPSATEDPLVDWLSYIKFHQEAYPAVTHEQFLLLERCFRALHKDLRYANDVRFIRVCCMYADKTAEPCQTFQEIYQLGIGHASATFWNAWAFVAERQQNFQLAEQIFAKGLRKQAQPADYLALRQKRFQRRMSRYWLNSIMIMQDKSQSQDDEDEDCTRQRGVLSSLSSSSSSLVHRHQPTRSTTAAAAAARRLPSSTIPTFTDRSAPRSTHHHQQQQQNAVTGASKGNGSGGAFAIFTDAEHAERGSFLDDSLDLPLTIATDREREAEAERWKENRAAAERWNERGALVTNNNNAYHHSAPSRAAAAATMTAHPPPLSAFAIHVDDECAAQHARAEHERQQHAATHRAARDDRASSFLFREHETSAMETLSRDPLLYVRHPEQAERSSSCGSILVVGVPVEAESSAPKKGMRPMWKNRLLTDTAANGTEQSFEEARTTAGYYTLMTAATSNNFNALFPQNADGDSSCMSMSMEELMSIDEESFVCSVAEESESKQRPAVVAPRDDAKPNKATALRRPPALLAVRKIPASVSASLCTIRSNASFESYTTPTPRNASTASSTIDEAVAVGLPMGKEEQTINTQLALKELSMMFSSPAIGLNDSVSRTGGLGPMLNESASSDLRNTSTVLGGIAEIVESDLSSTDHNNSSFAAQSDDNENESGTRNPDARTNDVPGFDDIALRKLTQETAEDGRALGCSRARTASQRRIGRVSQDDPFRALQERDLPTSPGFSIYHEEEEKKEDEPARFAIFQEGPSERRAAPAFQIFSDESSSGGRGAADSSLVVPPVSSKEGNTAFQIFKDKCDAATLPVFHEKGQCGDSQARTLGCISGAFQIYDESRDHERDADQSPMSAGDTATFSQAEDVFRNLVRGTPVDECRFPRRARKDSCSGDGDTATLSMLGELDLALEDYTAQSNTRQLPSSGGHVQFQIYETSGVTASLSPLEDIDSALPGRTPQSIRGTTDELGSSLTRFRVGSDVLELGSPKFGDISYIAQSEDATMTIRIPLAGAIDYATLHSRDIEESVLRVKSNALGSFPNVKSLSNALSTRGLNCDLPTYVLPRPLKRGTVQKGTQLTVGFSNGVLEQEHGLGFSNGIIEQELGRGVDGIVVLLEGDGQLDTSPIAVKAQSPIGCLAWEYEILKKVEDRVRSSSQTAGRLPFPLALSFVSLADGAMLTMSAGSRSGLNIVDLANVYASLGEQVPQILALHYTARMLHHLEVLHWHAKVLHCDAKPDNWVLTSSDFDGADDASDLMLVDFGRAIDLKSASTDGSSLMDTVFTGSAATEEMMCVAMRHDIPWSFDLDTFGVCASAHVLLFGAHLKLERSKSKRWMPTQTFPRHFEKDLWIELFDTLLNLDEDFGRAIGSRPYSVKRLRNRIEDYLRQEQARLRSALNRQSSILPSQRP